MCLEITFSLAGVKIVFKKFYLYTGWLISGLYFQFKNLFVGYLFYKVCNRTLYINHSTIGRIEKCTFIIFKFLGKQKTNFVFLISEKNIETHELNKKLYGGDCMRRTKFTRGSHDLIAVRI